MKQTYFKEPKYSKNYLILNPQNVYEQYINAFAFSEMVKSQNIKPNKKELQELAQNSWQEIKTNNKNDIQSIISELLRTPTCPSPLTYFSRQKLIPPIPLASPTPPIPPTTPIPPTPPIPSTPPLIQLPDYTQIPSNATAQKQIVAILQKSKTDLCEYNKLLQASTLPELRIQFTSKIKEFEDIIKVKEKRLKQLQGNAEARKRARKKKQEDLEKENIVELYDKPGRPSFLINDPKFLEKMHDSIEFGAADYKRRKEVIKVRTIKHLREKMEEDYNIHIARTTLQNYMQPRSSGSKEAQRHHHPAQIRLAAVGRNDMNSHIDEHYCLASVKGAKSFASAFSRDALIISQDDKAKVCKFVFFLNNLDLSFNFKLF